MGETSKIEFDVDMNCESCATAVRKQLETIDGISFINIDVQKQSVLIESTLPSQILKEAIESTGKRAVLKGIGSGSSLASAVAEIKGSNSILGVVRFHQSEKETCIIDGIIDGLPTGEHGLHIHEFGDLSNGCKNLGNHFNPFNSRHGGRQSAQRHYGDLGNVQADVNGRAIFRFEDCIVKVPDIIGRALAVSSNKDDLGVGNTKESSLDGNSGQSLACAIIARSAGLFKNPKRLCECDGITIWEERNVPVAGQSRSSRNFA